MEFGDIQPGRIRLARELKEISQVGLAGEIGVTPAAVSQFESGSTRPSEETLQRLGTVLSVPAGFFALPLVETHEGFFRSLRRTSTSHRRRARAIAHIAHDIATEVSVARRLPAVAIPQLTIDSLDAHRDVLERAAQRVRKAWRLRPGPIANMVDLLEEKGAVVIRLPLETSAADAFSIPFVDRPVIVLGADKKDKARSRFDASHELGHLVVHGDRMWGVKEVERQANQFAAAFLMPAEDIYDELPSRADWQKLFELKQRWQVSIAALLMRAKTLQKMSDTNYLAAIKTASARGWRRVEPVPLGKPEEPKRLRNLLSQRAIIDKICPPDIVDALIKSTAA